MELGSYSKEQLLGYLRQLDDAYHNGQSLIPDSKYDAIVEFYESKYGPYREIGAEPRSGEKVELPYFLPGLNDTKFKTEEEMNRWKRKFPGEYLVTDKIDGLSLLYIINGDTRKLYTRGNGNRGQDVSHLLLYLNLPAPSTVLAVRGEIVINKDVFAKYNDEYANPRNMTSGIVNATKNFDPELAKQLRFYAYRILNVPPETTPAQEFSCLQYHGFLTPAIAMTKDPTIAQLNEYFSQREPAAPYEMDGIVVYANIGGQYSETEAPKHLVAVKPPTETARTRVISVEWKASRLAKMKPVVNYEPVTLSGGVLRRATGYNAKYILENKIGPGAIIEVIRSGSTIPDIVDVISPSETGASMPDIPTKWDKNGVELLSIKGNNDIVVGKIVHFLETLEVRNFGEGRVRRLVEAGLEGIDHLLKLRADDIKKVEGFDTIADVFVSDLHEKLSRTTLPIIADASGQFSGIGPKRWADIAKAFPDILTWPHMYTDEQIVEMLRGIRGIDTLAYPILTALSSFKDWLDSHPEIRLIVKNSASDELLGRIFVFTGVRDTDLAAKIREKGGEVQENLTKKTTDLIYDKEGSGKYMKALQYGTRMHLYGKIKDLL